MSNPKIEEEASSSSKRSETEVNSKATQSKKKERKTNWPTKSIKEPHDNDVLYGRGGGTNHHVGNKRYRKMVEGRKMDYVNSKRLDKPLVALEIIRQWRAQDPPGRFLKLDDATGLWNDVGDKKAREKTSQALREKAPQLRKQQEDEEKDENGKDSRSSSPKQNSHDNYNNKGSKKNKEGRPIVRAVLARDHTLGRDYLDPKESVTVKGFSWNEPLQGEESASSSSHYPATRQEGWDGVPFVVRGSGSPGDSRSNNVHGPPSRESYMVTDREHSFANNPLREASISGPAHPWPEDDWDNRPEYNHSMHPQSSYGVHSRDHSGDRPGYGRKQKMYVGSNDYDKLARMMEDNDRHNYRAQRSYSGHSTHSHENGDYGNDTEPDYKHDQNDKPRYPDNDRYNKKRYSSMRHSKTDRRMYDSRYNYESQSSYGEGPYNSLNTRYTESYIDSTSRLQDPSSSSPEHSRRPTHGHQHKLTKSIPKPQIVKRETSHQNENGETKSNVKRKFRRNKSSHEDAQSFVPRVGGKAEDEMRALDQKMGRSTLDTPPNSREVSKQLSASKSNSG